ncbi:hypothetical protein JHK85_018527 [Glycine max]|nr:hypothetical protein JHK85_018527 [Glycine max]
MLTWLEGKEVVVVSSPSLASVLVLLLEQKLGYREGEAKGEYGKHLQYLALSSNEVTGNIAPELENLFALRELYVGYYNTYSDDIPPEIGNLSNLVRRHRVSSFGQHRPKTTLNPPSSTSFSRCSFTPQPPSSKPHPLPSLHITPSHLSSLDPSDVVRCVVSKDQITPLTEAKQLPYKHLYHFDCITLMAQTPHLMFAMQVSVGRGGGKRR